MDSALNWLKSVDTSRKDQHLASMNAQRKSERTAAAKTTPSTFGNSGLSSPAKVRDRVANDVKTFPNRQKTAEKTAAEHNKTSTPLDTFKKSMDVAADYAKTGNLNAEKVKAAASYGNRAAANPEKDKNVLERIGSGVGSIGMSLAASVPLLAETTVQAVKNAATGEKEGLDEDSLGMQWMEKANELRREATEGMSGAGAFAVDTALSIGQSLAALPTAVINPAAPLMIMGAQAGAQKAYEVQREGGGATEALGRGLISGGIEALTEKIPLDNLLDIIKVGGRGVIKNLLKQAGVEATEEGVSYTANFLADKAAGDPNARFSVDELLRSAAAGGVSGLFFGGAGSIVGAAGSQANGKNRNSSTQSAEAKNAPEILRTRRPDRTSLPQDKFAAEYITPEPEVTSGEPLRSTRVSPRFFQCWKLPKALLPRPMSNSFLQACMKGKQLPDWRRRVRTAPRKTDRAIQQKQTLQTKVPECISLLWWSTPKQ